ncbi:hypothetical protein [Shewanella algidipiscicola]|uniref:Uncharacterized protein n=1 Tax=Shewanella algidipiscicola TaxID=614070 RepID=A0ABQ4PDF9_9GAMM|nr:hypothetical protein [Shewanella algidipiscicola]GIU45459.1 hypothetical protein TUM4630_13610 [Shewanella algidipiscicola]
MKLAHVDLSEIRVVSLYVITCFMCEKQLHLAASEIDASVGDAAAMAASQGWHSYETADESCSVVCPSCIKETQENEGED